MNYQNYNNQRQDTQLALQAFYDPYVYETLKSIIGSSVVIETTKGGIHGNISAVQPDHVVLDSHGKLFFIRICKIVWVMPIEE